MEREIKVTITDSQNQSDSIYVNETFAQFIIEMDRMQGLYKNQRFTQAEKTRDELAENLDNIMRNL